MPQIIGCHCMCITNYGSKLSNKRLESNFNVVSLVEKNPVIRTLYLHFYNFSTFVIFVIQYSYFSFL